MLSQLAFSTFDRGDYFFKQVTVEQHIISYIRNLPGASDDEEALQLDGEAVLKSIEAQHGLLVERARNIYSFSHLTFQEYFTAMCIIGSTTDLNLALQNLVIHITEKRYREFFLLTAGMLPSADSLLILMNQFKRLYRRMRLTNLLPFAPSTLFLFLTEFFPRQDPLTLPVS